MANEDRPGFWPLKTRSAGGIITMTRKQALNANTLAIFWGDCVENDGSGMLYPSAGTNNVTGTTAHGASYLDADNIRQYRRHLPASTTGSATMDAEAANYIMVVQHPVDTVYDVQCDEALTIADMGLNFCILPDAGTTATGQSGHQVDATGKASTITLPLHIEDFVRKPTNDPPLADARWEVTLNGSNWATAGTHTGT